MADTEDTRAHGEPPLRTNPAGDCIEYIGSRAQLLAADIVGADTAFPGDPGQRKGCVKPAADPRRIQSIVTSSAGRYRVTVRRTDAELAEHRRRQAEADAQWKADRQREAESRDAARALDRAPRSFDAYRDAMVRDGSLMLRALHHALGRQDGGYRYAPDVLDAVALHVQAIAGMLESGTIEFDAPAWDAERARLHAVAARGDFRFDAFMRKAKAKPKARA